VSVENDAKRGDPLLVPENGFLGEKVFGAQTDTKKSGVWVIDPMTVHQTTFRHGYCCISVAYVIK